jgi:hypothetical protein
MIQVGLVAAPAGPATKASATPVALSVARAAMPALALIVRGCHLRTRQRPAGARASPEPGRVILGDEFLLVYITAPGDSLVVIFLFITSVKK